MLDHPTLAPDGDLDTQPSQAAPTMPDRPALKQKAANAAQLLAEIQPYINAPSRDVLLQQVHDFLVITGQKPTPFGREAAKDDKLLYRIGDAPNGISQDKADRVRAFMAQHLQKSMGHGDTGDTKQKTSPRRSRSRSV